MKTMNDLEIDNLPNRLTIFRMLLIPVVVLSLYFTEYPTYTLSPYTMILNHVAGWTFVLASITDFFDGYIARKRNIVTVFGSFLDPVADKFLVVSSLIMLMALERIHPIVVIVLVLREMYMTSLRLFAMNEGISIPVERIGKWKTAIQMIATPMLMIYEDLIGIPIYKLGTILMYVASFLSLWSAFMYSVGLVKKLKAARAEKHKKVKQKAN